MQQDDYSGRNYGMGPTADTSRPRFQPSPYRPQPVQPQLSTPPAPQGPLPQRLPGQGPVKNGGTGPTPMPLGLPQGGTPTPAPTPPPGPNTNTPGYGQYQALLDAFRQRLQGNNNQGQTNRINQIIQALQQAQATGMDPNLVSRQLSNWQTDSRGGGVSLGGLAKFDRRLLPYSQANQQMTQEQALQAQLLSQLPGMEQKMNQNMLGQQQTSWDLMRPQIEDRLNAMGIAQSGALPVQEANAWGQLDLQRQQMLGNFDMNARNQLQLQAPQQNLAGATALQQQDMNRTFSEYDQQTQANLAMQQQALALAEADAQRRNQMNAAWLGFGGQLGGGLLGAGGAALGGWLGGRGGAAGNAASAATAATG